MTPILNGATLPPVRDQATLEPYGPAVVRLGGEAGQTRSNAR